MRVIVIAALVVTQAACPRRGAAPGGDDRAQLTIPTRLDTGAALERLARRAAGGNLTAAWLRVHYLVDLFDDARFRRDDASLVALRRAVDPGAEHPAERGAAVTDRVLAALRVEVDAILARDRLHRGALAASTVLRFDAEPPSSRREIAPRIASLRAVAEGGGALAPNARLRLFGFCRRALEDSVRAPRHRRMEIVKHCLYPLYAADPAPYFAAGPRPPDPDPEVLAADLRELLARVAASDSRVAAAADFQQARLAELLARVTGALPTPISADAYDLPLSPRGGPYEWTPLVRKAGATGALDKQVAVDGRKAVAAALAAGRPGAELVEIAAAARAAGAETLELVVGVDRAIEAPPGDYWHGRLGGERVVVTSVLPIAAATEGVPPELWDPSRASLGLHLVARADTWRVVGDGGVAGAVDLDAPDPAGALTELLETIARGFPREDGLVVVPEGADVQGVVSAIAAARAVFSRVALGDAAPPAQGDALARRIERRARVAVQVEPDELASYAPRIRLCYLDAIEDDPAAARPLEVTLRAGGIDAPENIPAEVAACVTDSLADALSVRGVDRAVIRFAP